MPDAATKTTAAVTVEVVVVVVMEIAAAAMGVAIARFVDIPTTAVSLQNVLVLPTSRSDRNTEKGREGLAH